MRMSVFTSLDIWRSLRCPYSDISLCICWFRAPGVGLIFLRSWNMFYLLVLSVRETCCFKRQHYSHPSRARRILAKCRLSLDHNPDLTPSLNSPSLRCHSTRPKHPSPPPSHHSLKQSNLSKQHNTNQPTYQERNLDILPTENGLKQLHRQ